MFAAQESIRLGVEIDLNEFRRSLLTLLDESSAGDGSEEVGAEETAAGRDHKITHPDRPDLSCRRRACAVLPDAATSVSRPINVARHRRLKRHRRS